MLKVELINAINTSKPSKIKEIKNSFMKKKKTSKSAIKEIKEVLHSAILDGDEKIGEIKKVLDPKNNFFKSK